MVCWGLNANGQLGGTTVIERHSPVAVASLSGAAGIGAGGAHTCAHLSTENTKCWGNNAKGQIGDNTTTERHTPVVSSLTCP